MKSSCGKFATFYIGIQKPKVAFSIFHFVLLYFSLKYALVYVNIDQGIHQGKKIKKHEMKNGKSNFGFSYLLNMANFEAFFYTINLILHPDFLKSHLESVLSNGRARGLKKSKKMFKGGPWTRASQGYSQISEFTITTVAPESMSYFIMVNGDAAYES